MSETEDFEMEENEERKDGGQGERSKGKRISSGKKEVESRLERKDERVDGRMGLGGRMGIGESMKFSQDTPKKSENNDPQKFETPKKSLGDPLDIQIGSEILSDIKSEQETETTESEDEEDDKKYQNIPVKANIKWLFKDTKINEDSSLNVTERREMLRILFYQWNEITHQIKLERALDIASKTPIISNK